MACAHLVTSYELSQRISTVTRRHLGKWGEIRRFSRPAIEIRSKSAVPVDRMFAQIRGEIRLEIRPGFRRHTSNARRAKSGPPL